MITLTQKASEKLQEKKATENFEFIRLGITGGGCAGFEYVFESSNTYSIDDDIRFTTSGITILVDKLSVPYLAGMTLDYVKEGLNEFFKFINPKEASSCGCGVSINFDLDKVDESKILAIQI